MTAFNDITGNAIKTRVPTDKFRSGHDLIDWSKPLTEEKKNEEESEKKTLDKAEEEV
jgi:hypothetical protein